MNVEVRIITLYGRNIEDRFVKAGFTNVSSVLAVDLRHSDPVELYKSNLVSLNTMHTMQHVRKRHSEFVGGGAVGLQQSMIKTLSRETGPGVWTLMCEDDCEPHANLHATVDYLVRKYEGCRFDVVSLGPYVRGSEPSCIAGFGYPTDFLGCHCMLIPPASHRILVEKLRQPQEVQVDSYLTQLANVGELKVLVETQAPSARQQHENASTIQSECPLCNKDACHDVALPPYRVYMTIVIGVLLGTLLGALSVTVLRSL